MIFFFPYRQFSGATDKEREVEGRKKKWNEGVCQDANHKIPSARGLYSLGRSPNGQQATDREEEKGRDREGCEEEADGGKGQGFTTGDALLLTPIFAKREKDGKITLRGPQSITTNIK